MTRTKLFRLLENDSVGQRLLELEIYRPSRANRVPTAVRTRDGKITDCNFCPVFFGSKRFTKDKNIL